MANFKELQADPGFKQLSPQDQAEVRQRFYERHISTDAGFRSLSESDQADVRQRIMGSRPTVGTPTTTAPIPVRMEQAPQPERGIGESIIEGVKAVPGAVVDFAKEFGKAAITPPKEGFFDIAGTPRRLVDLGKGIVSGATAGIYEPEAADEAQAARHMAGSLGGFAIPFTGVTRAARAVGVGKGGAQIIGGAATGAAAPAVEGDVAGMVTGATVGGGLIGGAQIAANVFRRFYGRAPKDRAEIRGKVETDAKFRDVLAEFPDERLPSPEPVNRPAVGSRQGEGGLNTPRPIPEAKPGPRALDEAVQARLQSQATRKMLEDFVQKPAERRRVVELDRQAVERANQQAANYGGGGKMGKGIEALLARDPAERAQYSNVDYRAKAIYDKMRSQSADAYEALKVKRLGLATDEKLSQRVGRALFGEPSAPGVEGLARQLSTVMDHLRVRSNVAGTYIPKRRDFGLPQSHDVLRITATPKNQWVEFTLPKVKRVWTEKGMLENPEHVRGYLQTVYDMAKDDAARLASGKVGQLRLEAESRRIIFRNFDDWFQYSQQFGHSGKSVLNIVDDHLRSMSRQTALLELLGPRPRETLNRLMDEAARRGELTKLQRNRIERLWSTVSGEADEIASAKLANTGGFIRSWLVSAQLGSAPISAISDLMTGTMARVANGLPLTQGIRNALKGMSRQDAAKLGIAADHSLLQLQQSRFGDFSGSATKAGKAADLTLRASGLNAWTEAGRKAFGVELLSFLGEHVHKKIPFERLPVPLQRQLPKYGIQPQDWNNIVLKAGTIQKNGGHYLDLDSFGKLVKGLDLGKPFRESSRTMEGAERLIVGQFPKTAIRRRLAADYAEAQAGQGRLRQLREVEAHLREMVAGESEFAMISGTDARVKSLLTLGQERGSILGEVMRLGTMYKSFPLSILMTHLSRGIHQPTVAGKIGYLAPFVAGSTILGALSIQARELVKGRSPRDMSMPSFWTDALQQGGALTVFEGALEADRGFDRLITQAAGPAMGLGRDVFDLTAKNASELAAGKKANVGREVSRFAERYTPATNLWQTRLLTQRLFWNSLQRALDPDANESFRRQAAAPKKWGGQYWWRPGELVPGTSGPSSLADFDERAARIK